MESSWFLETNGMPGLNQRSFSLQLTVVNTEILGCRGCWEHIMVEYSIELQHCPPRLRECPRRWHEKNVKPKDTEKGCECYCLGMTQTLRSWDHDCMAAVAAYSDPYKTGPIVTVRANHSKDHILPCRNIRHWKIPEEQTLSSVMYSQVGPLGSSG